MNNESLRPIIQPLFLFFLILLAVVAPYAIYPIFLMKGLCFGLFASAFGLLLGYGGLLSFGHAMFFGFSAYITAHCVKALSFTPEISIIIGTVSALCLGVIVGWLAIRRQGIYFAMVTLALSQMVYFFCLEAPFTSGEDGIQGIPRGFLLNSLDLSHIKMMYYFVLVIFILGLAIIHRIINSPFGQVLKAIRDNEPRAISLGYDVNKYKLIAFTLSATIAGLAGSLKCLVFQVASLTDVHWHASGEVVLMTLLGGVGTMLGPALGAFIVVIIQNYFSETGSWVTIIQGVVFVLCVLLFPKGIVGVLAPKAQKIGLKL
jgi:branched-chain amino acid transport system permease protein